jgi:hypothetical protein
VIFLAQSISRVVITPEYGFQIDRWNQYLNGGEGDWGNVVYIGTDGQFHIDNGYLDMRKIVTNCAEDLVEQNRILIDPAIGFKIQKNLDIASTPATPNWFDVFYVDTEGDIKLADENGNGIILDQFGMDTKFIKWFKNMCWNSSFEVFDEEAATPTPTYWEGDGICSGDSSWFGDYSCRLTANGDYIQQTDTSATNPTFYDNVVSDTHLTRISFHKKRGALKVEVFDEINGSTPYTLTDTDGNSGTSLTFDRNENYIPESYSFNFNHYENGATTKFRLKFTNVDTEVVAEDAYVFIDAVVIEPDYTQRRPSFYTDGIKSQSARSIGDLSQIVVGTTAPTDTTKLWLDTN